MKMFLFYKQSQFKDEVCLSSCLPTCMSFLLDLQCTVNDATSGNYLELLANPNSRFKT